MIFMILSVSGKSSRDMNLSTNFLCLLITVKGLVLSFQLNDGEHFGNKAKPKTSQKPLNFIKCIEPTTLPLRKDILIQHIKQSWFKSEAGSQQNSTTWLHSHFHSKN